MLTRRVGSILAALAAFSLGTAGLAYGGLITGTGNPLTAISGGTQVTFDEASYAAEYDNPSSLTIGGVTFLATSCATSCVPVDTAPAFYINNSYGGNYNTTGNSLQNTYSNNAFSALTISFATLTSAFAFNWGAADTAWTLAAYDSGGTLIESQDIAPTHGSNAGEFYGLSDAGISYIILSVDMAALSTSLPDYAFLDNFTYGAGSSSVPEPATVVLLGAGLAGCLLIARKRA
jgi:hypothetical protein